MKKFLFLLLLFTIAIYACTNQESNEEIQPKPKIEVRSLVGDKIGEVLPNGDLEFTVDEADVIDHWNEVGDSSVTITSIQLTRSEGYPIMFGWDDYGSTRGIDVTIEDDEIFFCDCKTIKCTGYCPIWGPASIDKCTPKKNEDDEWYCTDCFDNVCTLSITSND